MKRLIAGIATLLIAGNAVALAEEPAIAGAELHMPYEAAETIDTVKDTVNQQMQAKIALQNYFKRSVKLADGVMQKASFPRHVSFYPVGRAESSQGTLLISQKGRQTAALVFMMDSLADDPVLGGFFAADTMPEASQNILTFYGRMQMAAGDIINASLLHGVEAVRDEDFPLPYDFAAVDVNQIHGPTLLSQRPRIYVADMRMVASIDGILFPLQDFPLPYDFAAVDVNQIHGPTLLSQRPRIYVADMRMVASIDGILFPLHIRQYLFRSQAHIHFMTVICRDSEFKLVKEKSDELVRKMAQ